MKFAKYLESESIPEWRKAYINYKGLKKRLKAVEKFRKANERKAAIELDHAFQGVDVDSDPEQGRPLFKTDTRTSEWRWPWNIANSSMWFSENPPLHRQPSFPHTLIRRISSRFNHDDTELARVPSQPVSIRSSATLSILEEALLHASESERVFFAILNGELEKVSRFYDEKESEARTKLEALKIQMQLIAEYGRRLLEFAVLYKFHHFFLGICSS
ncbi:SPX domain-containing protein [Fennellomyces sp. T-0311]|nr:SPX domain-containing protein [Fennellomyces sp. T-0311]